MVVVSLDLTCAHPTPLPMTSPPFWVQVTTAGINWSNTAVRAVLEQPCLTGGRTGTVRPKQEPTGRTDLSDRSRLVLCDRSQELIGQACPTRRQVLRSDSACPTTSRTRLFEHRSNCLGKMILKNKTGSITLNNVYYSPEAACTLLSVESLCLSRGHI
ncbi:hypothetical protein PCANC_25002 [Puccinia coronata f. sp. avenae]|uniref:Uncharacterized protein n=1 Tax=Puccinia coronata f. sp. avenae TaxID=200324 RepID=A0A2N5SJH9_9BASI|nr:hypothetical protein PCANC_25002 [Puccinia coronata f. sp. avenae]